jgi:hypothetical protein
MFENQGNDGAAKIKILQDSGYWGSISPLITFVPLTRLPETGPSTRRRRYRTV